LAISPTSPSRGGFFRPSRRSAPAQPPRQTRAKPKTTPRPAAFLLRLKTIPALYSPQLTTDFNRNMLRLRRMPTERKSRTSRPPELQNHPGNYPHQIRVSLHMRHAFRQSTPQNACSVPGRLSPMSEQINPSPHPCHSPKPMVLRCLRTHAKRQDTCPTLLRGHFFGYCPARR
jgi:hypothetical protein